MDQPLVVNPAYPSIQQFEPQLDAARSKNQRDTRIFIAAGCALALLAAGAVIGAGFGFKAMSQVPHGTPLGKLGYVLFLPSTALALGIGAGFCFLGAAGHTDHEKKKVEELLKSSNSDEKVEYYLRYQHKFTAVELYNNFFKKILNGELPIDKRYYDACDFQSLINRVRQGLIEERKSNRTRGRFPMHIVGTVMADLVQTALTSNIIDTINPRARQMILDAFGRELSYVQTSIPSRYLHYFSQCNTASVILEDINHLQHLSQSCNTLTLDCNGLDSAYIPQELSLNLPGVRTLTLTGLKGKDPLLVSKLVTVCPRLDTLHLADQQEDALASIPAITAINPKQTLAVHLDHLSPAVRDGLVGLDCSYRSVHETTDRGVIVHIRAHN